MKKTSILSIVSTVFSVILFIWLSTRTGLLGTFHWHNFYRAMYVLLIVSLFLPAFFGFIAKVFPNKATKIVSSFVSIFFIVVWFIAYCALSCLSNYKHNTDGLNLLKTSETIPYAVSPSEGEPIMTLAFATDPHWGSDRRDAEACDRILREIDSRNYDGFFILGDIAQYGIIPKFYDEAIKDLRENLHNTKYRILPGNHDAIVNALPAFKSTFMDKEDKFYYRMDGGNVHLLVINMLWDETELTKKQEKWLIKQLEEIPQEDTVIVISHCYIISSGYYDDYCNKTWGDLHKVMDRLCPIFEKYNVDLHLSGHDHFFEYLEKDNVSYYVCGTMGGAFDSELIYHSPYSKWVNNTDFGWLDVKVFDGYLELTALDQYGTVLNHNIVATK